MNAGRNYRERSPEYVIREHIREGEANFNLKHRLNGTVKWHVPFM